MRVESRFGGQQAVAPQQVRQGQQAEARAGLFQKVAAVRKLFVAPAVMAHSNLLSARELSANCITLSSPVAADLRRLGLSQFCLFYIVRRFPYLCAFSHALAIAAKAMGRLFSKSSFEIESPTTFPNSDFSVEVICSISATVFFQGVGYPSSIAPVG